MAGLHRLRCLLVVLICQAADAQNESAPEAVLAVVPEAEDEPPKIFSPNPPQCAAEVASLVVSLTDFAASIVAETSLCARAMGWHGQTIYEDKEVFPSWHNERGCALSIMGTLTTFCGITGTVLSSTFDCFNNDQGCGQTIVSIVGMLLQIGSTLIGATASCAPPGSGPPYYFLKDRPLANFNCYRKIWHVIRQLVRVAKFIDLAINLCPSDDETPDDIAAEVVRALPLPEGSRDGSREDIGAKYTLECFRNFTSHPDCANVISFTSCGDSCADWANYTGCFDDCVDWVNHSASFGKWLNVTSSDANVWALLQQQKAFAAAQDLVLESEPVERRLEELRKKFPAPPAAGQEQHDDELPEHVMPENIRDIALGLLDGIAAAFRVERNSSGGHALLV